ncbi:DUF5707 domain-containing protein [Streptomyces sp. NBC_01498]|uniref:DUF5707 domain-containing protein n=1 Tax=Streptomyces sp. NBC_01498 TaxID=2975870 RepID=UPI002E7C2663|nr:DUF5707 domain-containing protein [Streptomyces sp. NBC_01498]WTL28561.1 DUF5707 domain-containing protein [Streptomyces sp. NBC_01498]
MSRRTVLSVTAALAVLGGAGAFALAHAEEQPPSLAHSTARYTAPEGDRDGSLAFTTDVTASSGVTGLKVLAWPEDSAFADRELTTKDMSAAEPAVCEPSGDSTVRCSYTVPVTRTDAEDSPRGTWHVATLATAEDGTTTLDAKAADFTVR